jgi:rod shape-determining protein MreC
VRLAEAEALEHDNRRLRATLNLSRGNQRTVAVATLIGSTSASTRRFAFLSAGTSDGVRSGMPVTSPMGLVGRVIEAGSQSSRVLLLTDSESMVPVRRAGDDVAAFAEGRADGLLRIRLINLGINPLKVGDVFVTSGAGGLFRPGIAVAVATRITEDGAIAQLLSNPAATDVVMVEQVWNRPAVRVLASQAPIPIATPSPVPTEEAETEEEAINGIPPPTAPAPTVAPAADEVPAAAPTGA